MLGLQCEKYIHGMNVSTVSLQYRTALAAVERTEKDQTSSAFKKFTYNVTLSLKLSRNTGVTENNDVPSQSFRTANIRRKALQERATYLFSSAADSLTLKG